MTQTIDAAAFQQMVIHAAASISAEKQQINDRTSLLFSTTPLNPRRNGLLFQQNPRRTTQTKPDKPIAAPHKTTPKTQRSAPIVKNAARNAKSTTISRPNHLSPARKKRQYQPLFTAFSNSFVQTYNISVKQGKNDSIFV